MPETNVSGFSDDNDSSMVANRSDVNFTDSITYSLYIHFVICYVALALGIPGNILSAIVWLRGPVVSKNSSSVYLAALAVVDLAFPSSDLILQQYCHAGWFCISCRTMANTACVLEPLLVLTFSVERMVAIRHPLQVSHVYRLGHKPHHFKS